MKITKGELKKLLLAERNKQNTKHKQSAFMRRTLSIYRGMNKRLDDVKKELRKKKNRKSKTIMPPRKLPYTLDQFRDLCNVWLQQGIAYGTGCEYCGSKLTVKTLTPDHKTAIAAGGDWSLSNLAASCKNCNWQKGRLSAKEFKRLLRFLRKRLSPESQADVKRRLSLGGKWSPR